MKRRAGKVPKGEQPATVLDQLAGQLSAASLRGLVLELCLARGAYFVMAGDTLPRDLTHAVELYGIDAAAIQKSVADELGAKRAARVAKAKTAAAS